MENLLSEFTNVFCYQDDIVVTGPTFSDHFKALRLVLSKLQSAGLRLNLSKCSFFQEKISYLGHDIDKNGMRKNKDRTKSVLDSPPPTNVSEVRAFLGMVNYHSKFIPNFAKKMKPLYHLLEKNVDFNWTSECQNAFESIKKEICSDSILFYFDPSKKIVLTTDASNTAVAGVLSHEFDNNYYKPVAYISRALNKAETNYSTLEKEALAIIFSVTKLKQYLLGYHFVLQTDHKPLSTIFGEHKGIPAMAAARMQRWAFILSGFDYTIEYVKGALNTADSLSRISQCEINKLSNESSYINYVDFVNVLHLNYKDIAKYTRRDPILSKVMSTIQDGTVDRLNGDEFSSFRSKANELTVESGCILWRHRTVIPSKLQQFVLQDLHTSHLGIVKTKSLARSFVYWPKIDKDLESMVKRCEFCQSNQANPEKSSLIPWSPSESAWKRIHMDFAGPLNGFHYLVIIDSYSKWPEVFKTKDISAAFVLSRLMDIFCRYGFVDTVVSDNGRQFVAKEVEDYLKSKGIKHVLTAPGHPATNGQAENFVKTLKKSLIANLKQKKNVDLALHDFLFDYRVTVHCTTNQSPSKLMLNREIKSRFNSLRPPLVTEVIGQKQAAAFQNFRGKRDKSFEMGQSVYIRNYKNPNKADWSPAVIKEKIGPRNYTCRFTQNNRDIKRHLDQIRDRESDDVHLEAESADDINQSQGASSSHGPSISVVTVDSSIEHENDDP